MAQMQTNISSIVQLTDRISAFTLQSADQSALPSFQAGAHIDVSLSEGQTRSYSLITFGPILDAPDSYVVAVQLEPDGKGGSKQMHNLNVGDSLTVSTPKNDFILDATRPAVLLAGGIGITPLISMAATLTGIGQTFCLNFAGRNLDAMAYTAELGAAFPEQLQIHCDDDPSGALDLKAVIAQLGTDAHLYVCGPRGMIDAAKTHAETAGIPPDRVHFELFEAATAQAGDKSFEVEVASTGAVFIVAPGQSIIEALEDGGVDVMYDCQRGDCGICQCDVISGMPDHRDVVLSQSERDSGKVMQICVSRSKSARLVLDI